MGKFLLKIIKLQLNKIIILIFFIFPYFFSLPAYSSPFNQVRKILCKNYLGETCSAKSFTMNEKDLNSDGQKEWFFYGPSQECGAHGNCPLVILEKKNGNWKILYSDWGNSYETQILQSVHQGYHDLDIASDSGAFYWTKNKYIWNGTQYVAQANSTTYYLYDGDKLIKVSKEQWEDCSKNGKNCI